MVKLEYEKYKGGKEDLIFKYVVAQFNEALPQAVAVYGRNLLNVLFDTKESLFPSVSVAEAATEALSVWSSLRLVKAFADHNNHGCMPEITPIEIADQLVFIYGDFLLSKSEHLTGNVQHSLLKEIDLYFIADQVANWMAEHLPTETHPHRATLEHRVWEYWNAY